MTSVAPFELRLPRTALAVARPQEIASAIEFTYSAKTIEAAKQLVGKATAALIAADADGAADAVEKTIVSISDALTSHLPADFHRGDQGLVARVSSVLGFHACLEDIFGGPPRAPSEFKTAADVIRLGNIKGYVAALLWAHLGVAAKQDDTPNAP